MALVSLLSVPSSLRLGVTCIYRQTAHQKVKLNYQPEAASPFGSFIFSACNFRAVWNKRRLRAVSHMLT